MTASLNTRMQACATGYLAPSILALCLTLIATAAAGESSTYRTLDWADLVPADWERPIILPAPPAEGEHHEVDKSSLQHSLDEQDIALPGFMIPIKFEQNVVSELLLVPFLEQHVAAHVHHDPNQMVYVYLQTPMAIHNPFAAVTVQGRMQVDSVETDEGPTGYAIHNGLMKAYVYPAQQD